MLKDLASTDSLFCFVFVFLGLFLRHMEVPRLEVKLELQLPAYSTATAMQDPSHVCDLHHSSWQCWVLNPLSEAGDRTCILMDTSWVHNPLSHSRNSIVFVFLTCILVVNTFRKRIRCSPLNKQHPPHPSEYVLWGLGFVSLLFTILFLLTPIVPGLINTCWVNK